MHDLRDIIGELSNRDGLPRDALRAARERRAESVGPFLAEIEQVVSTGKCSKAQARLIFFAFHLLGEWRETSACKPLARLLRMDREILDEVLGDATASTSHRIMSAVFDGDSIPICDVILDAQADESVRSRMCETLAILAIAGRLERAWVRDFLRDAYLRLKPEAGNFVWNGWQEAASMLGATELLPLVKQAFETELIDPSITSIEYFERDLARAKANPDKPWDPRSSEYEPWDDTVEEFSSWYGFSEKYREERDRTRAAEQDRPSESIFAALDAPYVNPNRGVGRNDPCPCGSGKKYKKCCLE